MIFYDKDIRKIFEDPYIRIKPGKNDWLDTFLGICDNGSEQAPVITYPPNHSLFLKVRMNPTRITMHLIDTSEHIRLSHFL